MPQPRFCRSLHSDFCIGSIEIAFAETPRILLFQPYLDVAMQKNVTGYRYWFHRQLDYRQLAKV